MGCGVGAGVGDGASVGSAATGSSVGAAGALKVAAPSAPPAIAATRARGTTRPVTARARRLRDIASQVRWMSDMLTNLPEYTRLHTGTMVWCLAGTA